MREVEPQVGVVEAERGLAVAAVGEAQFLLPRPAEGKTMTVAEKKVARQRLSAMQLAEALGNVSEACRRRRK